MPIQTTCERCGYIASATLCKACIMLDGLNKGRPELSIGKNSKRKRILRQEAEKAARDNPVQQEAEIYLDGGAKQTNVEVTNGHSVRQDTEKVANVLISRAVEEMF